MISHASKRFLSVMTGVMAFGMVAQAQVAPEAPRPDPAAQAPVAPAPVAEPAAPVTVGGGAVQAPAANTPHSASIFVVNRLGEKYKDKVAMFEDLVVAKFTDLGFSIASPEDAVKAIQTAGGKPTELDRLLENESSRLALARNMGTDYLIVAGLNSYDEKEIEETSYGTRQNITIYYLTTTYKILERNVGGSLKSGDFTVSVKKAESKHVTIDYNPFNELARKASGELARKLETQLARSALAKPDALGMADFTVSVRVQDFTVPNIVRNAKGEYEVSSENLRLLANGATIVLDGAAIGTAPGLFRGPKGMHKMRVSRDGCRTWEENVSINDKARFDIDLQLTNESIARFKEMAAFLQELKTGEKLADANAERIRGFAQMLRQSGYKVDIKVDATSLPTMNIHKTQSLWSSFQ